MWHKQKNKNPIVRLALLLALASTPIMTSLLKSDYALAQSPTETPSFALPNEVPSGTTIRVDGSASMSRANEALKERFEKDYSGTKVELNTSGTDDALKALQEGKVDIAAIGRGLTPKEKQQGLEQQRLRREKIAIIVGKDNPYKGDLTNQQFTKVYRGEITDWSELGGPSGKIRVLDRPDFSDTREAFRNYPLFRGDLFKTGSTATQLDSDDPAEVVKQLGDDGIGFVLANQVSQLDNVRILSMHKTLPDNPKYPYSQPLVYVFKKNPSEAVQKFIGFATAAPGKEAIEKAREQEAAAVAQTVAQAISGDGNATAQATPTAEAATTTDEATPTNPASTTPGTTEAATTATTTDGETANNGTVTEGVGTATNTSANGSAVTGDQAFVPAETAGEATSGTIPWYWFLLPVAALGALVLWLLLGRRKSQEDDTVARGVLPEDSPPPFTPSSTSTSGAVKEPVANTPVEPTAETNTASLEAPPNTTPGINAAGIAAGAVGLGLGAAALGSSEKEDTSVDRENSDEGAFEQLPLDAANLQQPDDGNVETPDWEEPDIPDTGLDLEAPAAVVNSSHHSLPRISTPIDEEAPKTDGDSGATVGNNPQGTEQSPSASSTSNSTSKWLGNFALGGAAAAGAARIKSKLAGKDAPESDNSQLVNQQRVPEETVEVDRRTQYPQLPDVWETPENSRSHSDEPNTSFSYGDAAAVSDPNTLEGSNNTEENSYEQQPIANQLPKDLWGNPETQALSTEEPSTSFPYGDYNAEEDPNTLEVSNNTEENSVEEQPIANQSPSNLWENPETQALSTEEPSTSFPYRAAAAGAAALGGIAAIGSNLFNRENDNAQENPVEEQEQATPDSSTELSENPQTEPTETNEQENPTGAGGFARFGQNTSSQGDDTIEVPIAEEQGQITENSPSVSTTDLPQVRIITSNEQLPDATALSTPEETISEQNVAQFGVSSNSEDNPDSNSGAPSSVGAFTLASQMLDGNEESKQQDVYNPVTAQPSSSQASFAADVALDRIADEAEADTVRTTSEQDSDEKETHGVTGVSGESNIFLANRTPKWAYASWNIAADTREAMQNRGATQLVLRLYDVTNIDLSYQEAKLVQQYECEATVSHRYVAIPNTERDYIAQIGYLSKDKEWLLVSRSPSVRVFSRPHEGFWFEADAELIIHGATEPGSTVTIDGENIKVKQDGTFHLRVPFTESLIDYLITAVAPSEEEARTIHMQFSQKEQKNS